MRERSEATTLMPTFASTDHKVAVNTSKATPNDMVTLVLSSKLAREPTLIQVPQMYFLSCVSSVNQRFLVWIFLTSGAWLIRANWESSEIFTLVSSPSVGSDLDVPFSVS